MSSEASQSSNSGQTGRAERRGRRIGGATQPWQFRLDSARHRLAQRAAEIERPVSVRHHFGRDALEAITLAERRLGVAGRHQLRAAGRGRIRKGYEHRDQFVLHRHDTGHPAHLAERHALAGRRRIGAQGHIVHVVKDELVVVDMREQRDEVLARPEIDENSVTQRAGLAAAGVAAIRMDGHHARGRFAPFRRLDLEGQAIFVGRPVDPDLVADHQRRQQRKRAEPFEIHLILTGPQYQIHVRLGMPERAASNRRVLARLIPARFWRMTGGAICLTRRNQRDRFG